jgi:Holliday junction resolvase RusA-like endonuclease
MLTNELVITIPGNPAPKGSLKCIGKRGSRGHVLIEDNTRTKPWREHLVSWLNKLTQQAELGQPIGAEITFTLPRPAGHYGTGKNAKTVRPSAPTHPTGHQTGDVDKLLRLVLDALQDTDLLPDDCAVIEVTGRKAYPADDTAHHWDVLPWPGVRIRLYPL